MNSSMLNETFSDTGPQEFLTSLFTAAVQAVDPLHVVPSHLPVPPKGRTLILGAGKASARMALAVEQHWQGKLEGLVVTRYGHAEVCSQIEIIEAGHPVPDQAGSEAAQRMLAMVQGLCSDDLVIFLISGGGSSLLSLPAEGITFAEKKQINAELLKSGANIRELNCVRKHLSAIKAGRLALACYPAQVLSLIISDVPGDDPAIVASGPSIADASSGADAWKILQKYAISTSESVKNHLLGQHNGAPSVNDPRLTGNQVRLIATAQDALEAGARIAREKGYTAFILSNSIEGEASEIALMHAAIVRQVVHFQQPFALPCVILSGGETSVTVRGQGRGGRNAEFMLALAIALEGMKNVHALACDTDGIDGTEDNAGCRVSPATLSRAAAFGLDAKACLHNNDAYAFFEQLNDLIITGPTRTNVNDFRAILINA